MDEFFEYDPDEDDVNIEYGEKTKNIELKRSLHIVKEKLENENDYNGLEEDIFNCIMEQKNEHKEEVDQYKFEKQQLQIELNEKDEIIKKQKRQIITGKSKAILEKKKITEQANFDFIDCVEANMQKSKVEKELKRSEESRKKLVEKSVNYRKDNQRLQKENVKLKKENAKLQKENAALKIQGIFFIFFFVITHIRILKKMNQQKTIHKN